MTRKKLFRQLYVHYLIVILFSLLLVAGFAFWALDGFYRKQVRLDLKARAHLAEPEVRAALLGPRDGLIGLCRQLGRNSGTRFTIILSSGEVIADSDEDPARMDNHGDRPEIEAALQGRTGYRIRYSHTLGQSMVYVAVPMIEGKAVLCVLRASMPMATVGRALRGVQGEILLFVASIALAAMILSLVFSRRVSRPLEEMKHGAMRFAGGELDARLAVPDSEEMAGLAEAMNSMAANLNDRLLFINRQRGEQEAILAGMAEGVIAVSRGERIISINQAACAMLGLAPERAQGRSIQEAVRNVSFHALVAAILTGRQSAGGEMVLEIAGGRSLQARGAVLKDSDGENIGAVVVLNDITQLRRLENHRREFVANVSHELRTPITSIKGFVETLLDGAIQSPEEAQRFLNIIARQVDQLNAIIEDLLVLSRIEQDGERDGIPLEPGKIRDVLESAIEVCSVKAGEKDIGLGLSCDARLTAAIHFPLLTQAVVNLVNNAIQFSLPGSPVQVEAKEAGEEVAIVVRDRGCGIAREHIPRLTERFYRVDKARSRKVGGTGLGLAIVKHIVQVHHGRLSIESVPGQGSVFTIHLPLHTQNMRP